MDTQTIINILIGAVGSLVGWVLKGIKEDMKDLQLAGKTLTSKVQEIELLVVGDYVKNDDLEKLSSAIFTKLDRIETKLDRKVDKSEKG